MVPCVRPKSQDAMSADLENYPRYLEPGFIPFDPLALARRTEEIVCRGDQRKYTKFYCAGVYGGIATGYTCGCCLRCVFCWVDWSRDFPEKHGTFLSPDEAFTRLGQAARKAKTEKLRISGAEPTLGKKHLLDPFQGHLEPVESWGEFPRCFHDCRSQNHSRERAPRPPGPARLDSSSSRS